MRPSTHLVADSTFILATRETGYRGVVSAVSELLDNAIQANAKDIRIFVRDNQPSRQISESDIAIAVLDDGDGMDRETLRKALQFGGTTRFGNREGLGRFGMGLPNSSVSQSRRVEIYSWQDKHRPLFSYLDVDEVARQELRHIPLPKSRRLPHWVRPLVSKTGTLVVWNRCDRLQYRKTSVVAQRLLKPLGRMYRHLLWNGVHICVNDESVPPIDPLFCHPRTGEGGAIQFGSVLTYEIASPFTQEPARVTVRFTELPVARWHDLSIEEKRTRGIIGGAGVSVIRAGREIDFGWYLMGAKRKENYDEWWRCEICFPPDLDEFFGVTHSKQSIAPTRELQAILTPDIESAARALNGRVRTAFESVNVRAPGRAERAASRQEILLRPLATTSGHRRPGSEGAYRIRTARIESNAFFDVALIRGKLVVTINVDHPFFEQFYAPSLRQKDDQNRFAIESLILAAARAERVVKHRIDHATLNRYRAAWGDALSAFLERRGS